MGHLAIVTGELFWNGSLRFLAAGEMTERARKAGWVDFPGTVGPVDLASPPLRAILNQNRWCVICPDCLGSEYVFAETPLQMCMSCWNSNVGGLWRRVELPNEKSAIEAALLARPMPMTRNWDGETVDELIAENVDHGLLAVSS